MLLSLSPSEHALIRELALAKGMYGMGRPYFIIPISIVIGLFVPVPFWIAHKFFPKIHADAVVTPIVRLPFSSQRR